VFADLDSLEGNPCLSGILVSYRVYIVFLSILSDVLGDLTGLALPPRLSILIKGLLGDIFGICLSFGVFIWYHGGSLGKIFLDLTRLGALFYAL